VLRRRRRDARETARVWACGGKRGTKRRAAERRGFKTGVTENAALFVAAYFHKCLLQR
jgi:hypothetical protein